MRIQESFNPPSGFFSVGRLLGFSQDCKEHEVSIRQADFLALEARPSRWLCNALPVPLCERCLFSRRFCIFCQRSISILSRFRASVCFISRRERLPAFCHHFTLSQPFLSASEASAVFVITILADLRSGDKDRRLFWRFSANRDRATCTRSTDWVDAQAVFTALDQTLEFELKFDNLALAEPTFKV